MTHLPKRWRRGRPVLLLGLALLCASGCASSVPAGQLTGTVYDGDEPLRSDEHYAWAVQLVGSDGAKAGGPVGIDGSYVVDDPPVGPVRIAVVGSQRGGLYSKSDKRPTLGAGHTAREKRLAPFKDPEKSGLSFTVTRGKQQHDVRLPR
jgi:hypothetical protein